MWFYSLLLLLLSPVILWKIIGFKRRYPNYRLAQAFGLGPKVEADLWIHCASVGEVLAVRPLVLAWQKKQPTGRLLITTVTPTGAEQVAKSFPLAQHKYLPVDWRFAVMLGLSRIQCPHLWIVETELWPNLLRQAKRQNLTVDVINARLSERSFRQYQRFSLVSKPLMSLPDRFFAHAEDDAQRLKQLGAKQVLVTGNVKFDLTLSDEVIHCAWREQISSSFVWIAASTHEGEDGLFLEAHAQLLKQCPDALLLIVPRHPERFEQVFQQARQCFTKVARRSSHSLTTWSDHAVVVGDSMGELLQYYQASDVAFVAGSMIERGGHNPIEAALLAKPVLVGPHTFNFKDITEQLVTAGGALRCDNLAELQEDLNALAANPTNGVLQGQKALAFAQQNQGAVERILSQIDIA